MLKILGSRKLLLCCSLLRKLLGRCAPLTAKSLWAKYHSFRVAELVKYWDAAEPFLGTTLDPIFVQSTSMLLMLALARRDRLSVASVGDSSSSASSRSLSIDEEGACMYAEGFVVHKLLKKYMGDDRPVAAEYVETLKGMQEASSLGLVAPSDTFIEFIKTYIDENETALEFFKAIELVVFSELQKTMPEGKATAKDSTIDSVLGDDSVQLLWSVLSVDIISDEDGRATLVDIANIWLKMRGHSYASQIMEDYKCSQHKHVRGSKGVRKQLKYD